MNIIGKKHWYFVLSLLIIIPGIISLFLYGLNLSVEFTGGSQIGLSSNVTVGSPQSDYIIASLHREGLKDVTLQTTSNGEIVQTDVMNQNQDTLFIKSLFYKYPLLKQENFESIGPSIGKQTTINAIKALTIASVLIVFYITLVFRKVPKPASSFRFGVCAIIALIHDVLVVVGIFSILGHFFGVESDSLFFTAVLTVIGFSVHDTIVVFDRIRENLSKTAGFSFSSVVNESILQTLDRSLNTSLTVILVLLALLLFGGQSIRWFVVALLIGITSGTYSSIFNASPLLVLWHERATKVAKK